MITTASIGRIQAGKQDVVMHQRVRTARPNPVIYCNSATSWPYELGQVSFGVNPHMRRLVEHGFVIIAPDMDVNWGNSTARAAIDAALAYADTQFGADAAPILAGASHGSTCVIMYALDGAVDPLCVLTFVTIADLVQVQSSNVGGLGAQISAAWPGGVPDTKGRASEISATPFYMHYASDDPWSVNITTFASNHGNTTLDNVGALGHTDAAMAAADTDALVAFVEAQV